MKLVSGLTLAEILAVSSLSQERGKALAIQLAEGLAAAHKEGILHCDFKPANVIVEQLGKNERAVITDFGLARALGREESIGAGTPFYMAPELREGKPPSVRTDIYAFGKVLEAILPKHSLVAQCLADDPNRRPESMDAVHKALNGGWSRRQILAGTALVGGSSWAAGHFLWPSPPTLKMNSQQRVKVNGFLSDLPETARSVRNLFIIALRQSPLVSVLGDPERSSSDKSKTLNAGLALPLTDLLSTSRQQKVGLAIDGNLARKGDGLRLTIHVYDPEGSKSLYTSQSQVDDRRQIVPLADQAAKDLRLKGFGESNLHSTYMPLEQITSASPVALDYYFRAIASYEKGDTHGALLLLDEALALDPGFVLGYHYRAFVLTAHDELEAALASEEKAVAKRQQVTERERNWIDGLHFSLTRAFDQSADALQTNTVKFPDEAIFQRLYAFALMRLGHYEQAIPYNKAAVDLDPFSDANTNELLVNLAEFGKVEECFAEKEKFTAQGRMHNHFHRALALAYLQSGQYEESLSECRQFGQGPLQLSSEWRLRSLAPLIMMGRFSEAILWIQADLGGPKSATEHTYTRHSTLGQLHQLQDNFGAAAEQADYLVNLPTLPTNLIHLREGCALAFELKQTDLLERGLDNLKKISAGWPSEHSRSAVLMTQAMLKDLQGENGAGALFAGAKITWADPINLMYAARWEGKSNNPRAQLADLDEVERLRGKIYKYHFAGLVVLNWFERAKCLRELSAFEESLRMYERVVSHWGKSQAAPTVVSEARREKDELKRRLT